MNLVRVEEEKTSLLPALIERAAGRASSRFLQFFTVNIRNPHTRAAYARGADEFLRWCEEKGIVELGKVTPLDFAGYVTTSPMSAFKWRSTWLAMRMRRLPASMTGAAMTSALAKSSGYVSDER